MNTISPRFSLRIPVVIKWIVTIVHLELRAMPPQNASGHVLVVEDHDPTARLVVTAIEEVDPSIATTVVGDGRECLSVLRNESGSGTVPDIVLLDLDLPDVDGHAVLEKRAETPSLRSIPVIVLSETNDPDTVDRCYRRGANSFISKPGGFDGYLAIATSVVDYWFSTVDLPRTAECLS